MQNFDPKLFESQNLPERKQSNTASDRAVRRTDKSDEGRRSRKKFKLEEKKSKSKETDKKGESKTELPSAFSLAAKGALKDSTEKEFDDSDEEYVPGEDKDLKEKPVKDNNLVKDAKPLTSKLETVQDDIKAEAAVKSSKTARIQLEELLRKVIDSITQMKLDGKNEMTVVIKHPPLFANAKLTLTSFDTAKGEFNITFSELNAKAKELLDMQMSRESLMKTLEEKGYITHIMVATTEKEETLLTASESNPREQQQQGGEQEGEKKREAL